MWRSGGGRRLKQLTLDQPSRTREVEGPLPTWLLPSLVDRASCTLMSAAKRLGTASLNAPSRRPTAESYAGAPPSAVRLFRRIRWAPRRREGASWSAYVTAAHLGIGEAGCAPQSAARSCGFSCIVLYGVHQPRAIPSR